MHIVGFHHSQTVSGVSVEVDDVMFNRAIFSFHECMGTVTRVLEFVLQPVRIVTLYDIFELVRCLLFGRSVIYANLRSLFPIMLYLVDDVHLALRDPRYRIVCCLPIVFRGQFP